jgi:hypothetical protein
MNLDDTIDSSRTALDAFAKGDAAPVKRLRPHCKVRDA